MTADLHHLAAAYALDALDDIERQQFERHYPSCDICSREVEEFRSVAAALAESTTAEAPAGLKDSLMAEIAQTRQLSPIIGSSTAHPSGSSFLMGRSNRILMAAAAALVLLAGVLVVTLPDNGATSVNEVVSSVDAVVTTLDSNVQSQSGDLQIVWSRDRNQVAVVGSNLEDPGTGNAYALWFLLDDGVVPAGLFRPRDGTVSAVIDIDDLEANGWGITIEPESGSEQPTTAVIYAGTV